ncbi:hypothetical protein EJ357_15900 [Streptomyces cyaneochromogenes]|uniref:Uncharacterized protein n=1 Tax=Streptomyces cyaneochromogenes TaxID=2496836 RepID=A0A3Q9EMX3_9ACTN|nr:hypothetical protein [Streptomyces cyaneochromogenes]AZQ34784.1 hypothetical protein EJ357_15900 [Streptomyces cyaneochromogenes]
MAAVRRSVPLQDQHQMFRGVFDDWQTRAGALSALPDAPVVPDEPRQGQTAWRRLRTRFARTAVSRRPLPSTGRPHDAVPWTTRGGAARCESGGPA